MKDNPLLLYTGGSKVNIDKIFNPRDEIDYYRSSAHCPPSIAELDFLERDMSHWVPDFPSIFSGKKIIDLGAGTAPVGTLISQRFSPSSVVSLELVFSRLRSATLWMNQLPFLNLTCGDIFNLPFQDKSFDIVIANSVLHHLGNVDQAILEIARVLKPDGMYIGREPNFDNPLARFYVFKCISHTANEYPLRSRAIINSFNLAGCRCEMHYFSRRLPILKNPILSIAMSVRAMRDK